MINSKLTEWLYYVSPNSDLLDKSENEDLKYLDLNYPHRLELKEYFSKCSSYEFVYMMISIFKNRFPLEYAQLKNSVNDNILDVEYVELEKITKSILTALKINFKSPQIEIDSWVENALSDKVYSKIDGDVKAYYLENSPIKNIEVSINFIQINIDQN
jgi:hypothetical protein